MSPNLSNISLKSIDKLCNEKNVKYLGEASIKENWSGLGFYFMVLKTEKEYPSSQANISKEYPFPNKRDSLKLFLNRANHLLKTNNSYLTEVNKISSKGIIESARKIKGKLYSLVDY